MLVSITKSLSSWSEWSISLDSSLLSSSTEQFKCFLVLNTEGQVIDVQAQMHFLKHGLVVGLPLNDSNVDQLV